jgi:hypothetical protein
MANDSRGRDEELDFSEPCLFAGQDIAHRLDQVRLALRVVVHDER